MKLTPKQSEAWNHFMDDQAMLELLYGGAKGGGKSHFLCVVGCAYAKMLIKEFGLTAPQKDPIPVGFMGRKRSVDFRNTTLATWKRVIPHCHYRILEQKQQIIIDNRVAIAFGGLDDQQTINKFNSAEYAFMLIDQAEETEKKDVAVLEGALRLKVNGIQPRYRKLYTANPEECWLKSEFDISGVNKFNPESIYVPALFTDNEHLPDNYEATLNKAFGFDEKLLRAYKTGDWNLASDTQHVITRGMLELLNTATHLYADDSIVGGLDPACGGDECVGYLIKNYKIIGRKIMHEQNPKIVETEMHKWFKEGGAKVVGVDAIGVGYGIAHGMKDLGTNVVFIKSADKAKDPRCHLQRDEIFLHAREIVQEKKAQPIEDMELINQITAIKFKMMRGKIKVEPTEAVKSRIGKSPDRAMAYIYALWTMKFTQAFNDKDFIDNSSFDMEIDPMAC